MPFKLNPFTSNFDYYSTTSAIHASSHEIGGADLVDHDNLTNFVANEHIDWTADQGAVNIHAGNYADNDTTDHTALSNIGTKTHAQIDTHLNGDGSDHADVASNTTNIGTNTTAIGLNTTHRGSNGSDHSKVTVNETAIALNTTHRSSDGSDHSKVGANETAIALNTTHRGSNGSDHSKVTANETATALNTTHRGSSGSDHSDVVANTTARHTQGADTTLGVMTADINMNSLQQVVNLQLPAASGEAIRQTIKITETNMEAAHDHVSATGDQHGHDTHDHSTALGTAVAADLSDITSTGANIEDAVTKKHTEGHSIASHNDTTATGAELETLTDNSIANTLHRHSELVASDGSPDPALSVDTAGNIGVATTDIEAWEVAYKAIEFPGSSILFHSTGATMLTISNAYYDGVWKYKANGRASYISNSGGDYTFANAPSGTANTAITWTIRFKILWTGKIGIGTSAPAASTVLDLVSTTGALLLPRMTTAQRNALTGTNGMILYDTTLNKIQVYENGAWISVV